ncbi:MAG: hypothetical protein LBJ00_13280 [Planctomycetaceae bacterium]|jgi:tetratricopeptide (TPR) repeat protein|nr:hypothetical protein [Planctomycetaceae bacterium]
MKNKSLPSLKNIQKIRKLCRKGDYNKALEFLDSTVPDEGYTEEILICKANLIELADTDYSLQDVEDILIIASNNYPDSADVHFEMGKFLEIIKGDTKNALKCYKRARMILENDLNKVVEAIGECENEI